MEENNTNWWLYIAIGVLVWSLFFHQDKYEGQTAEEWFSQYDYQVDYSEQLKEALEEANNNIEEANDSMIEAQSYAWESYDEMAQALEDLSTVDTVSEP